jgi:hypothetical protein
MFHSIKELHLYIVKFQPIHGNGYNTPIPPKIRNKNAVLNI